MNKPITVSSGQIGSYNTSNLSFSTGVDYNGFGTTRMTILKSNGNAGIGLLNPTAKLDLSVEDNFVTNLESVLRITYPGPIAIGVGGSGGNQKSSSLLNQSVFEVRQHHVPSGNFSSKFIVKSNDYVGIGEFKPVAKLHVNGDTYVNNGKIRVMGNNDFGGPQIVFG